MNLSPEIITGNKELTEGYYKKIDEIENAILDGEVFENLTSINSTYIKEVKLINKNGLNKEGKKVELNDKLVKEIFKIKDLNTASLITFDNKFFVEKVLAEEETALGPYNKIIKDVSSFI